MNTYFVDKIKENAERYPDRIALARDFGEEPVTYSGLWEESGRIYAALKSAGIGREDIVMLLLPRHPMMITALIGVLRSGAAALLAENTYPAERIEYMKSDCGVKYVIDTEFIEKAAGFRAKEGREQLFPHDACLVFYTSGTTGKPKGILHEYGKLDLGISGSVPDEAAVDFDDCGRFAFVPPFNFSATVIHGLPELYKANTLYILSYEVSKNFKQLHSLLEREEITELFLSPSVLRAYGEGFAHVRAIMTGSEPADHLFVPGRKVIVHYGMTESLCCISTFVLEKSYTAAPIASKYTGDCIRILDENGVQTEDGRTGEICFPNPYFRGYVNMPEKTREVMRGGIFHSGDLGYRSKDGDVFILGRSDDMIKINGNRMEPGEIEGAAREISGIKNVIAKGFIEEGRSYVALYYIPDPAAEKCIFHDAALSREALAKKLPQYMIPSYFIPLDAMPLNANGKIARKLLPKPETLVPPSAGREPENETEKLFCGIMADVLSLERIGADDDFYEVGGDSMSAIRLVSACSERGFDITVSDLLQVRNAAGLARLAPGKAAVSRRELEQREKSARCQPQKLLSGQKIYWKLFEKYPDHPSICVPVMAVLKKDTDLERLKAAADRVILHHPALLSRFRVEPDGNVVQFYDEGCFVPAVVEDMSDEELASESRNLTRSVNLLNDRLYTLRIIRSPEKNVFLLSVHHIAGDASSNVMLLRQIAACYDDPDYELPPDCYYTICAEENSDEHAALKQEAADRNKAKLDKLIAGNAALLRADLPGPDSGSETFFLPNVLPKSGSHSNRMLAAACLTAMAEINGRDAALIYTAYNGRDSKIKGDSAGCHTVLIPVCVTDISRKSGAELMSEVQIQLDFGASHALYSAITENTLPLDRTVIFNFQSGTMEFDEFKKLAHSVSMIQRDKDSPNCLFNAGVLEQNGSDALGFYCNYPRGIYLPETVSAFGRSFRRAVRMLAAEEDQKA